MQGFKISTDKQELDLDVIHDFVSKSYWAAGIPKDTMQQAINNSLCFGVYKDNGEQVGFARLITDSATFAYLADVFILEECRGLGLSKLLMDSVINHSSVPGLRRMMLATRDAHGLYAQYGFEEVVNPEILMQKWQPNIYQNKAVN